MKRAKLRQNGFAHYLIPVLIIVVVGIGGALFLVIKTRHDNSKSNSVSANSSGSASTQNSDKLNSNASTSQTEANTNSSSSTSGSTKSSSSSSTSSSSAKKTTTTSTASASTPSDALLLIITGLYKGNSANVTVSTVTVPGPISDAKARPLVFTFKGHTYFAYTQTNKPDFNTTASQTAASMALVSATTSNPTLISAHLDKTGELVDANLTLVGYSTGGN